MPIITSSKSAPTYDVIIVGSGAGGGQAAYTLALEGVKVAMLEAGRNYDPVRETPMFQLPSDAPLRDAATPDKPFGFHDATVDGGWQVPGEPYTNAAKNPEQEFWWWRARMLGGRTNHWGRISLRNGPYDFKPRSRDGIGFDWPIGYEDLAPYYDKVEMLIGVSGENSGLENTPDSPPGCLLPAPKFRAAEMLIRKHAGRIGIPVVPIHRAVLTRQLSASTIPAKLHPNNPRAQEIVAGEMRKRLACFWATPCGRGCSTKANYQSTTVHLPPALASGNLDIIPNAMARELVIGKDGKATGVRYIDKTNGQEMLIKGRAVILAASSGETVRIMLNSKNAQFPNGVANRSGKVGRYLMDSVGASLGGQVPSLENLPPLNEDGAGGAHAYIPWWQYKEASKLGFPRGYHVEISGGRAMPKAGIFSGLEQLTGGSYGKKFKEDARRYYGSWVHFTGRGEMVPNEDCYCEIDPEVKDKWGIPVLRFHWKWSEYETRQAAHMQNTFAEIVEAMGGKPTPPKNGREAIEPGGKVIHEVGGALMGATPEDSVVNQHCQSWDVKNLFLCDGSAFPSNADKNPTLTIMALAWRTCDHLIDEMKKGNI